MSQNPCHDGDDDTEQTVECHARILASIEMDPQKRLNLLKEIAEKVQQDLVGVPLFETSRLYAVQDGVRWEPRLDGLVLGAEVK